MNKNPNSNPKPESNDPEELSVLSNIPQVDLIRTYLAVNCSKPDSKYKLFHRRIAITFENIKDLNTKVVSKLNTHLTVVSACLINVKLDKSETIEFTSWNSFASHDWNIPLRTQEISVKWDFAIKFPNDEIPQRHRLSVRLATSPNPRDFIKIMLDSDLDEVDDIDSLLALCVARVDFTSYGLADELLNIVETWNEGLRIPKDYNPFILSLTKVKLWMARIIHYSVPFFITILLVGLLFTIVSSYSSETDLFIGLAKSSGWTLASITMLWYSVQFSRFLANHAYQALDAYGAFAPFYMTRGDELHLAQQKNRNKRRFMIFIINALTALLINLIAAGIAYKLFPSY